MHPDSSQSGSCNGLRKGRSPGAGTAVADIRGAVCHRKGLSALWPAHPAASSRRLADAVDKLLLSQRTGAAHPLHTAPLQPLQGIEGGVERRTQTAWLWLPTYLGGW